MRPRVAVLLASILVLVLAERPSAHAQASPSVTPGARVRVHTAAAVPLTGRVVEVSGSEIILQAGSERVVMATADIRQLEVGTWRSGAGKGARVGALVGGLVGLAAGIALMSDDDSFFDYGSEAIPAGVLGGGVMGLGIGVVIGALSGREEWTTVQGSAIALEPTPTRAGIGMRIQFWRGR
ncbi:MAG TPA: hypothetical protein VF037_08120 [Gemmatimonadales bacterium]